MLVLSLTSLRGGRRGEVEVRGVRSLLEAGERGGEEGRGVNSLLSHPQHISLSRACSHAPSSHLQPQVWGDPDSPEAALPPPNPPGIKVCPHPGEPATLTWP